MPQISVYVGGKITLLKLTYVLTHTQCSPKAPRL